jgi:Dolichyl-phosphate-mannose-protein mannosyltransferase
MLAVILLCVGYPYSFDWAEGGLVNQAGWVLSGKPLYARPSLEFTSFMYQPLYIYVSALASRVLGLGLLPLRLVSLLASAGTFIIVYLFARRESGKAYYGIVACGLFAACYIKTTGSALNLARVDQLFLFLFMAGAYAVRFHASKAGYVAAGALLSLSFLTKQTALVTSLPLLFYAVVARRKTSPYLIASFAAISGGSVLLLDRMFHGWYSYYVFKLPGRIPFELTKYAVMFKDDLMAPIAIACVASLYFLVSRLASDREKGIFYLMLATGALTGSWLSRLNSMAYPNVVLPAYCVISILFALGVREAVSDVMSTPHPIGRLAANFIYSVCIIQLVLLLYNPLDYPANKKDMEAGADFVKTIAQFKGEVFAPDNGYTALLAGKRPYSHYMALYEILREGDEADREKLIDDMGRAVREKRFDAIIFYPDMLGAGLITKEELAKYYDASMIYYEGVKYWPGKGRGGEYLCVKKPD